MRKIITTVLTFFVIFTVSAQRSEIGLFGGASYYCGDLNPIIQFQLAKPAVGLFYRYNFDERLAIKLGFTKGGLEGNDDKTHFQPDRNYSFKSSVSELSAQFEVNFCNFSIEGKENSISPYIFGGIGLASNNITEISGVGVILPNPNPSQIISFPFGIGVKMCPLQNMTIGLEWGMRKTNTDNLDGDFGSINDNKVSTANDWYSFAGFSISYRLNFFNSNRCF
ncbi:MAG: outer membrane beta-barrel protein [Bacteroidetes bacterium]|nr:outer membrane beta-barrel protein [Bacteroidota bacterium]